MRSIGGVVLAGDSRRNGSHNCPSTTLSTTNPTPTVLGLNTLCDQGQNKRDTLVSYWNMEKESGKKCIFIFLMTGTVIIIDLCDQYK